MDRVDAILAQWGQQRPDLDLAAMGPLGRLARLRQHLLREMEKTFAAHGLNAASFDVLATLRRSAPPHELSPGDLMATMMVTSGTMTNRIDQLEKAGLVRRRPNPADGRGFLVGLTGTGLDLIDRTVTDHAATQARLAGALTAEELAALDRLLRKFLVAFEH